MGDVGGILEVIGGLLFGLGKVTQPLWSDYDDERAAQYYVKEQESANGWSNITKGIFGAFVALVVAFANGGGVLVAYYEGNDVNCLETLDNFDFNIPQFLLLSIGIDSLFLGALVALVMVPGIVYFVTRWPAPTFMAVHFTYIGIWIIGYGSALLHKSPVCKQSANSLLWYRVLVFVIVHSVVAACYLFLLSFYAMFPILKNKAGKGKVLEKMFPAKAANVALERDYSDPANAKQLLKDADKRVEEAQVQYKREEAARKLQYKEYELEASAEVIDDLAKQYIFQNYEFGPKNIVRGVVSGFTALLFGIVQFLALYAGYRETGLMNCVETIPGYDFTVPGFLLLSVGFNWFFMCLFVFLLFVVGFRAFFTTPTAATFMTAHLVYMAIWIFGYGGAVLAKSPNCKASDVSNVWIYTLLYVIAHGVVALIYLTFLTMFAFKLGKKWKAGNADKLEKVFPADQYGDVKPFDEKEVRKIPVIGDSPAANGRVPQSGTRPMQPSTQNPTGERPPPRRPAPPIPGQVPTQGPPPPLSKSPQVMYSSQPGFGATAPFTVAQHMAMQYGEFQRNREIRHAQGLRAAVAQNARTYLDL